MEDSSRRISIAHQFTAFLGSSWRRSPAAASPKIVSGLNEAGLRRPAEKGRGTAVSYWAPNALLTRFAEATRHLLVVDSDGRRMGRYKDYREPKRRGFDEDYAPQERATDRRPGNPRPSASQPSEPLGAIVKWFKADKGFGFVAVVGGSDAFIHIRQLEAAGHSSLPEGARVKVRIGQGQKGPEVTEVIEVDTSTAQVTRPTTGRSAPRSPSQSRHGVGATTESAGSVLMYNPDKGFGFVGQDGGGKDVFVHVTTLERTGLSALAEGQRVRMQIAQGPKGLEARSIELLD
jgi:cold shock protein